MPVPLKFTSLTHHHLFACINTILLNTEPFTISKKIRILDLGCGSGRMLADFVKAFKNLMPDKDFEFYGLDVNDALVQKSGYFEKTIAVLNEADNSANWNNFLCLTGSSEHWPYADNFFDFIISNQVMEHVNDHYFCFKEISRTLTEDGFCFNLYPLRHVLFETHLFIPLAHKFTNWSKTYQWIKFWGLTGAGSYKKLKASGQVSSIHEYAETHADKMAFQVNYLTVKETSSTAKKASLKPSFDFTHLYYCQKIRSLFGLQILQSYNKRYIFSSYSIYFFILKYVSSITLVLRKKESNNSGETKIKKFSANI